MTTKEKMEKLMEIEKAYYGHTFQVARVFELPDDVLRLGGFVALKFADGFGIITSALEMQPTSVIVDTMERR